MWLKLTILITLSLTMISYGIITYKRSLSSKVQYDFREDIKHSFLTPHRTYSGFFNDGKPRRIVPALLVISGAALLVIGLLKIEVS